MKKSIFLLLFLFLALVVTCVYQKTYTLYETTHAKDENTKQTVSIAASQKKEQAVIAQKKVVQATPKVANEPKNETKEEIVAEKPAKELSFLEKIKTTVVSAMTTEKKDALVNEIVKKESKPLVVTAKKNTLTTKVEEKEVVDYLLTVLKEQDVALANRDEAESKLHALITQVLEERHIAIENMEKASLDIDTRHQKRLDERDVKSQNIYTINTKEGK